MSTEVFEVLDAGPATTLQDLGRHGHESQGVPPGGALDHFALVAANRIVGNPDAAAALECRHAGLRLTALRASVVAVTGGEPEVWINRSRVPAWTGIFVAPGDEVRVPRLGSGAVCYLARGGGFEAKRWLGSGSTYLPAGLGGLGGRRLRPGDRLRGARVRSTLVAGRCLRPDLRPALASPLKLRALAGPHLPLLEPQARSALFLTNWTRSPDSDRSGYRYSGEALAHTLSVASLGTCLGSVQLPPDGRPVLLLAEHPTVGGYPLVACVISADLPLAAQMSVGQPMRLELVSLEVADRARRLAASALATIDL